MLDVTALPIAEAATAVHARLRTEATATGQDPDIEVALFTPEQAAEHGFGAFWTVVWEAGPYDWGVATSLGDSQLLGLQVMRAKGWYCDTQHGFDLRFVEDRP